jgi:lysozyme
MRFVALASCLVMSASCFPTVPDAGDDSNDDSKAGDGLSQDKSDDPSIDDPTILEARVCAAGATTFGVDVSYYNDTINWPTAKNAGVDYAFIRVSDGTGFHDPKFAQNWTNSKAAGVLRGAYQFFRPSQDVNAQADILINAIKNDFGSGDLPPVIDVEVTGSVSAATITARVHQWINRVKAALGVDPIIYTGFYFWRDNVGNPSGFANNPLWVAAYVSHCPDIPSNWSKWAFWQYYDKGKVAGIPGDVDVDHFNGSLDDLIAFAGGTTQMPPPDSCASATMNTDLPNGSCVQAASDELWYRCDSGSWTSIPSSSGCSVTYAWCESATLGKAVPPRTCVQAASDSEWYQCDGHSWAQPTTSSSGPAGTCSSSHPL